MLSSRERVLRALGHIEPDRVPLDLGAGGQTGMHVSVLYQLRQALGLDAPGTPVKVWEPYQMLGQVEPDLAEALGVDVVGLPGLATLFGFENKDWKEWRLWDGTPLLVPGGFNTDPESDGSLRLYPEGDKSAPPSGIMPRNGFYFDAIVRQPPIDEERLDPEDNLEEFGPVSQATLDYFATEAKRLNEQTDQAIFANFGGTAFGDIALVPATWLKHPRGIRDIAEWYMSTRLRRDYIYRVFERQCEIALENLAKIFAVVGNRVHVVFISGTDFGMQSGLFVDVASYRDLFKPFHQAVNGWIHRHTQWKTFIHSCGAISELIPEFIEAGFGILNPVQCSVAGMEPRALKERFGRQITFWGGGVNTQQTLPFGTPEAVRAEVRERLEIFAPGGGFVFNPIHNVQAGTPIENVLAMYETVREFGDYGALAAAASRA